MKPLMPLAVKLVVGSVGYVAWALMAWADPSQRAEFLHFNVLMAMGTIGLVLRDMPPKG